MNLTNAINDSFTQYSAAVLQSRALVDVRDCCKPSTRQILYCMYTDNFVHEKPFQKTLKAIGSAMRIYIHGDSSCEGIIMRCGQNFAMRYPLVEVEGNAGNLIASGNYAAPRYTASRLTSLSNYLFADLKKKVIDEWRDNYDDTEQYPMLLPSKGFYNLVNGNFGIAIGASSSVPQYNLKELNNALITLLLNPDCSFDEIYCEPDFATGATIINAAEVKESHRKGNGAACKIRSTIDWDSKERCLVVTEIPYMVYTETICEELENIINSEDNPGIERFNDLTGKTPLIKIYISKKVTPDKIIKFLYKNTSLQSYYGVNFTMLDDGRYPKVFTWKEVLQAHINHEKQVYRKGFQFDLKKIEDRIHIINGLLICMASIEEVVKLIKSSSSTSEASKALQANFLLDEIQAKAVLDMKLSRLAHLEVKKLEDEKTNLENEADRIRNILNDTSLFNQQLVNGWKEVADKFGDERRTKILQLASDDNNEVIEEKQLVFSLTNKNAIYIGETSSLYTQKRNGVGSKIKLDQGEYVINSLIGNNTDTILLFTSHGNFYHIKANSFSIDEKQFLNNFITILPYETVIAMAVVSKNKSWKYIIFVTEKGIIKKSLLEEYNLKRNVGATAINLDKDDKIISILFTDADKTGIATKFGNFIIINTDTINPIGRAARGVCGIKLNEGDKVVDAKIIPKNTTKLVSITSDGYIKNSDLSEFHITNRGTKGVKIQRTEDFCNFLPIENDLNILIISSTAQIKIKIDDIPNLGRGAQGVKSIKLLSNSKIISLQKLDS